jgi:hypothetical protein
MNPPEDDDYRDLDGYDRQEDVWGLDDITEWISGYVETLNPLPARLGILLLGTEDQNHSAQNQFRGEAVLDVKVLNVFHLRYWVVFIRLGPPPEAMPMDQFLDRLACCEYVEAFLLKGTVPALRVKRLQTIAEARRLYRAQRQSLRELNDGE